MLKLLNLKIFLQKLLNYQEYVLINNMLIKIQNIKLIFHIVS